jgi:hypothetical protein
MKYDKKGSKMVILNSSQLKKCKSLASFGLVIYILIVTTFPLLIAFGNHNFSLQPYEEPISIKNLFETPNKADPEINGTDYLIITPEEFYENIIPLAQSKENKGLLTKVVNLTDIATSPSAENISEYIQNAYDTWNSAPTYVLLIGDVEFLPTHYMNGGPATDLYYATVVGDDYYPDIYVGRFPVKTTNDLDIVVNKTLDYENNFDQSEIWRQNILLAAYEQSGRYYIDTSEAIRQFLVNESYTCNTVYTGGSYTGTTQDVIDLINEGTFIANHRNHGARNGWSHPSFTISDISSLNNSDMLPVMFSVNCDSGHYDHDTLDCFGETILKAQDKGVVGYLGSSRGSYSGPNDELNKGFFSAIWPDYYPGYRNPVQHSTKLGAILNYGKHFMFDKYSLTIADGYSYDFGKLYFKPWKNQYQFEIYNLFGDPELSLMDFPHDLSVDLEIPNRELINNNYYINASVINNGVNLESDVDLVLCIDDIPVASRNILDLSIGEKVTIDYSWTPTEYGIYNITAYASPIMDEFSWSNNIFTEIITINHPTTPFKDDLENGLINWYCNTSLWHITDDNSAWSDPYHSSSHAIWFGNESTGDCYTGAQQMGNLISDTIDLTGAEKAYIEFDHWRETKFSNDFSYVYISTDGCNWDLVYSNNSNISPWEHVNLNISSYVGNESIRIRFCFDVYNTSVNDYRGWLVDDICIKIEETVPPTWVEVPQDQTITYSYSFHYELKANDFFGIEHWWLNNTDQFSIDENGVITKSLYLPVGEYWLEIRAYDPFDNFCSCTIKITILQISPLDFTGVLILIGAPLIVIGIAVGIEKRKRNRYIYR